MSGVESVEAERPDDGPDLARWSRRIRWSLERLRWNDSPAGGPALYAGLLDAVSPAWYRDRSVERRIAHAALPDAGVGRTATGYYSYAEQHVVVALEGGPRRLRAAPPGVHGGFPFAGTAYVLSAWNPGRRVVPLEVNVELGERLARDVAAAGWAGAPAATVALDRRWAEAGTVVVGAPQAQVLALAQRHGAPAVVRWDAAALTVIPLAGGKAPRTSGWTLEDPATRTCPMLRGARPGERCAPPDEPAALHRGVAKDEWTLHRRLLLSTLGCSTCQDGDAPGQPPGSPRSPGSPVAQLVEVGCASRWGAAIVRRRRA